MLLSVFHDLVKPQWCAVFEELKRSGSRTIPQLAESLGTSYMTVKDQCEALTKSGYLIRQRLAHRGVGRPEIQYSLGTKADTLFPQAGLAFSLELLSNLQAMFGEHAPEKLMYQYFDRLGTSWIKALAKESTPAQRAKRLAKLRTESGGISLFQTTPDHSFELLEIHHPMQRLFDAYPRVIPMELAAIERAVGIRLNRQEIPAGRESSPHVRFFPVVETL